MTAVALTPGDIDTDAADFQPNGSASAGGTSELVCYSDHVHPSSSTVEGSSLDVGGEATTANDFFLIGNVSGFYGPKTFANLSVAANEPTGGSVYEANAWGWNWAGGTSATPPIIRWASRRSG